MKHTYIHTYIHTLLSSGCTPHIYKEEGACLPGQQKEWDLYTSAKVTLVALENVCSI